MTEKLKIVADELAPFTEDQYLYILKKLEAKSKDKKDKDDAHK